MNNKEKKLSSCSTPQDPHHYRYRYHPRDPSLDDALEQKVRERENSLKQVVQMKMKRKSRLYII